MINDVANLEKLVTNTSYTHICIEILSGEGRK
jgi:hypothetical protein